MSEQSNANTEPSLLSITLKDKNALYAAYMPFLKKGGLFIPTGKTYQIGAEVFIILTLMDEPEKFPIAGRVAWVTPKGAQGSRSAGIGVQFSDLDGGARNKIETYLADMLDSERMTQTM